MSDQDKMPAAARRLHDLEQQIAELHRQQRDVRFLAKRLAQEVELRLNKRAKGSVRQPGLTYASDRQIQQELTRSDRAKPDEALAFIHECDRLNIRPGHSRAGRGLLRTVFWKLSARLFRLAMTVGRRLVHGGARG